MDKPPLLLPFRQLLSLRGRITRLQYLAQLALYIAILAPLALTIILGLYSFADAHPIGIFLVLGGLVGLLTYLIVCLHVKRLHDLGMPAIISIVLVISIPFVCLSAVISHFTEVPEALGYLVKGANAIATNANIGIGAYLLMAPGQIGANKYGADPFAVPKGGRD